MDIQSPPAYLEEDVVDLEFNFSGSEPFTITLRGDDSYNQETGIIQLVGRVKGTIIVHRANVLWEAIHYRKLKTPIKPEPKSTN